MNLVPGLFLAARWGITYVTPIHITTPMPLSNSRWGHTTHNHTVRCAHTCFRRVMANCAGGPPVLGFLGSSLQRESKMGGGLGGGLGGLRGGNLAGVKRTIKVSPCVCACVCACVCVRKHLCTCVRVRARAYMRCVFGCACVSV